MKKTLLLVDIQNDFLPGGALAVQEGDLVVPVANRIMHRFDLVVATQDWHPADHGSFASRYPGKAPGEFVELNGFEQILWPDHCVRDTFGAELAQGLLVEKIDHIVQKGMDRAVDSYSGFFDNDHKKETGLADYLRRRGVETVAMMGLATDYCVKYTALDARGLGFDVNLITDGVRGVELTPGDCDKALEEMKKAGVRLITSDDL